jgi:hypothetical protein
MSCKYPIGNRTGMLRLLGSIAVAASWASTACAQQSLPPACFQVTSAQPSLLSAEPPNPGGVDVVLDSVLRLLPANPRMMAGNSIWKRFEPIRQMWLADSVSTEFALATIVSDDRDVTTFTAVVAAQYYERLSGRGTPMLPVFASAGEPPSRLAWVLMALRAPLDSIAEAQVFGHACNAAWELIASEQDPYLRAREQLGHSLFRGVDSDDILSSADRLISGKYRQEMSQLMLLRN